MVVTQIGKGVIYYRPLNGGASFCVKVENWKHVAAEVLPNAASQTRPAEPLKP